MKARGSRAQVMHGTAKRTSGGLRKQDLKYNKQRKIVSRKMSLRAKKEKRLIKAGYKTKKGTFGSFKNGKRVSKRRSKRRSRRRKQRGGVDAHISAVAAEQLRREEEVRAKAAAAAAVAKRVAKENASLDD
jgi:hypothetical protein